MPPGISKKSWLGVAREAAPGTAMTAPTLYDPTKSNMKAIKKREFLEEERGDRNEQYDAVDVARHTEWDKKGPLYPDVAPYYLGAALGSISSAQPNAGGAPTVYKHTISLADVPYSLTLFKSYASQFYYSPYSVVEKFSIKFSSEKLMEFDCSGKAIWPQIWAPSGSVTFSQVQPFPGYAPTIKLFNALTTDVDELEITFEQKITLWVPSSGVIDWVTAYYGARKVGLSFTARFDSDVLYQRFKTSAYDMFTLDVVGAALANLFTVTLGAPSAGNFTLTYGGSTTATIAYNASASAVQTALQALPSIPANSVTVSGSVGGPYTVSFTGSLLSSTQALTGSGAGLTGGTFSVSPQSMYNYELNAVIPVIEYDSMEHDLGKDNVLVKAKATALATKQTINSQLQDGTGNNLLQMFIQNTTTGYAS